MMPEQVALQREGPIARVAISGPESGNRITAAVVQEIDRIFGAVRDEDEVRCVILHWSGGSFSGAGGEDAALAMTGEASDPFACVAGLPQPVVAAIEGEATGGELSLVLAADIRVSADTATFAFPEIAEGQMPLPGSVQRLVRLTGRGNALSMLLTGERIDAVSALRAGLVSEVVPAAGVLDRAQAIAEAIAGRGPIAVRYAKEAISRGMEMPLEQALRFETDLTILLQTTADRAEGVRAFGEKRQPEFKGE
jgi:enoyl-CoA hydratase